MRSGSFFGSAIAALFLVTFAQGCFGDNTAESEARICTPGAYVFCRCADRAEGTKLCKDGKAFEACTTGAGGECAGGEIDDPDTGKPVDENGEIIQPEPEPEPKPVTNALDTCPGKPTAVGQGEIVIEGDTTGAADDLKGKPGACTAGSGGPDHVYRLQPTATGNLSIKVQGQDAMNPTVYLRTSCEDEASQVACGETTGAGGLEQFQYNVVTGKEYFLVVDGASGSAGKYTVTLKLTPGSFCGDGKVDTNEACDDGNKVEGDGCSNSCQKVDGDPATANGCPGQPVHVWPGRTVTGTGSTTPFGNTWTKTGSSCTVSQNNLNVASEHVYEVTAHAAGNLVVTMTPEATQNLMLVARTTCADPASQGGGMCANTGSAGQVETMTFPVQNGQKVYVAVDGVLSAKGTYDVSFKIQ